MERVDADHALAAVEQCAEPPAAGFVGKFLHAVAHRHGRVAHDVDALLDLEHLVGRGIAGREELHLAAALACRAALVFEVYLHALAAGGDELPVFLSGGVLAGACGRTLHPGGGGKLVVAERPRRVLGIRGQPGNDHLAGIVAAALLHGRGQVNDPVRSDRGAVRAGDVDAVDEDHAQIAVLGGALGRHIGLPAGRQEFAQCRIGHDEIELHAVFRAVLDEGFRPCLGHRPRGRRKHEHKRMSRKSGHRFTDKDMRPRKNRERIPFRSEWNAL